jgi:hypothetical protein
VLLQVGKTAALGRMRCATTGLSNGVWLPAASIPVVGFNAILMSEHFGAFFAFAVLHAALAIRYIKVCSSRGPAMLAVGAGGTVLQGLRLLERLTCWQ